MQQPFNQPGGSYGNAPYAAPPPRRGFNWLTCCLGCFGLAVILAIAMGALFYAKLSKSAGPAITTANYQAEFPAGVPIFPGLTFDEQMTAPLRYAGGAVGFIPNAHGARMRMMVFRSPKPASVVGAWYKSKLVPKGWSTMASGNPSSWQFEKGDEMMLVSDANQQQQAVMIAFGKGLPAKSHTRIQVNP
ncbi:MAG TPA: hypothetical protein VGM51_05960 [Armatimonadota bacterium]|jgi:hypothetical protein